MNKKDVRKKKKKSIKSKIVTFVFELIVFIGLGAIAYPTLSNWWNERHQTQAISSYVETVQELSDDGKIRMMEGAKRYNESLAPGVDFVLTDEEYEIMKKHPAEGARIMAICDVYDALRSNRHYKEGFSVEKSVSIIRESRGSHFDPDIADIFLQHIDEMEAVFIQNNSSPSL